MKKHMLFAILALTAGQLFAYKATAPTGTEAEKQAILARLRVNAPQATPAVSSQDEQPEFVYLQPSRRDISKRIFTKSESSLPGASPAASSQDEQPEPTYLQPSRRDLTKPPLR